MYQERLRLTRLWTDYSLSVWERLVTSCLSLVSLSSEQCGALADDRALILEPFARRSACPHKACPFYSSSCYTTCPVYATSQDYLVGVSGRRSHIRSSCAEEASPTPFDWSEQVLYQTDSHFVTSSVKQGSSEDGEEEALTTQNLSGDRAARTFGRQLPASEAFKPVLISNMLGELKPKGPEGTCRQKGFSLESICPSQSRDVLVFEI